MTNPTTDLAARFEAKREECEKKARLAITVERSCFWGGQEQAFADARDMACEPPQTHIPLDQMSPEGKAALQAIIRAPKAETRDLSGWLAEADQILHDLLETENLSQKASVERAHYLIHEIAHAVAETSDEHVSALCSDMARAGAAEGTGERASATEFVLMPRKLTDEMRFASWENVFFHHGAGPAEAHRLATEKANNAWQRSQDDAGYAGLLEAAPPPPAQQGSSSPPLTAERAVGEAEAPKTESFFRRWDRVIKREAPTPDPVGEAKALLEGLDPRRTPQQHIASFRRASLGMTRVENADKCLAKADAIEAALVTLHASQDQAGEARE